MMKWGRPPACAGLSAPLRYGMVASKAMKRTLPPLFVLLATAALAQTPAFAQTPAPTANTDIYYRLAPDAVPQDGVPQGEISGPFTLPSQAYPGTQHTYWVYVPAQYDPAVPASLMIYNDGQAFMAPDGDVRAQVVMDNLIYRREIPVMIGVFINPGRRPDQPEPIRQRVGRPRPPTGPPSTTPSTINTPGSSWMNCCRCSTRSTTSRRIRSGTGSAGRVRAPSPRSPWRGSGRTTSAKC